MKLSQLKPNSSNPRRISEAKLQKLKTSIESFEQMMEARPMIINADMEILGGNMRYRALNALGYDEIPDNWVKQMDFTPQQEREFIIKDNVGFGEWDWDVLDGWDAEDLEKWGLDDAKWRTTDEVDLDNFFTEASDEQEKEQRFKIVLEYTEDDYNNVIDAFSKIQGSKEKIVAELLGI